MRRRQKPAAAGERASPADAEALRQLVENSRGMVTTDEAVITTITTAVSGYLDGQTTAEEAARQIQSRLSLYMAERS